MSTTKIIITAVTALLIGVSSLFAAKPGIISGSVVDIKTGDKIVGASVRVIDANGKLVTGGRTKTDGSFRIINVTPGVYKLKVTYVGYKATEVSDFEVKPGAVAKAGIKIGSAAVYSEVINVSARRVLNNDAALLSQRQKAAAASDGIGAAEIAAIGASDAGSVMSKMTGATTEGGKHIIMRGLGDRYVNAQLNGASLASADPDKKSVDFDLFPSGLLDNIIVTKTATPDKPGDFTGGTVNISTKSFPDKFTVSSSYGTSYNSQVTGRDFLTYDGGKSDWLGMDDGTRSVPDIVRQAVENDDIPLSKYSRSDKTKALYLDELSNAFGNQMVPTKSTAPVNNSFGLSVGNQYQITDEQALGFVGSLSYGNSYSSYDNGELKVFNLTGSSDDITTLDKERHMSDFKSTHEVSWGALVNVAYSLNSENTISANVMYNQSGSDEARIQSGMNKYWDKSTQFDSRVLKYTERNLTATQLSGEHKINSLLGSDLNWQISYNVNSQENPNLRFFTNEWYEDEDGEISYFYAASNYGAPSHFYRDLTEDLISGKIDYELPLQKVLGTDFDLKVGGLYSMKHRDFIEELFYKDFSQQFFRVNYTGDSDKFFAENSGIVDVFEAPDGNTYYDFGVTLRYLGPDDQGSAYEGDQNIMAGYGMIDWDINDRFRIVGGVRYEQTDMSVRNTHLLDSAKIKSGEINQNDILPSVNAIFTVNEDQNLRLAYGKTLARPNFREFAPYHSFEYAAGYILQGNQNLERTIIDNFDIRWEWFPGIGEIVAVSGFSKHFQNPIERVILNVNNEVQYQNVERALLVGAEFEFKKSLGFIAEPLNNLSFSTNFTYTYSRVDISDDELERMRAYNPDAADHRQMQGQSPYIFNINLAYSNLNSGTTAGIYYNIFGDRLSEVSLGGNPDIYEYSRPSLRLNASQDLFKLIGIKDSDGKARSGLKLKLSADNLLDSEVIKAQEYKGNEFINVRYKLGRSFSLGLSYSL